MLPQWMVSVAYGSSVASDIMLASILIVSLLRTRSETKAREYAVAPFLATDGHADP